MHKSRLAGLIIDCKTDNPNTAADFWQKALGAPAKPQANQDDGRYVELTVPEGDVYVVVQAVEHASRVHIDIETDDIEAEVSRLEALGASRLADVRYWVVMEAPTGQRFCVVPVVRAGFDENANRW